MLGRFQVSSISAAAGPTGLKDYIGHSDELSDRYLRKLHLSRDLNGPDFNVVDDTTPIEPLGFDLEWRCIIPEFDEMSRFRINSERFENMPLEDRVRLVYSVNSCGLSRWNPHGYTDPLVSYVNLALDSPSLSFSPKYNDLMIKRAKAPFADWNEGDGLLPEELSELRRIADRLSTFQRVMDYDFFNYAAHTPATEILHHRVPSDAFEPTTLTIIPRIKSSLLKSKLAGEDSKLFINEFPWYYRPYFFVVGLVGKVFTFINMYFGSYSNDVVDYGIAGSIFDPRSPAVMPTNQFADQTVISGCGTSSAFTPKKEDPGQYFSDVNIYIRSLSLVYLYSAKIVSNVSGLLFSSDTILFQQLYLFNDKLLLLFVLVTTMICLMLVSISSAVFTGAGLLAVAVIFEMISVGLVVLYGIAGLLWFDPMYGPMSIVIITISSVEFAVVMAGFVVLSKIDLK